MQQNPKSTAVTTRTQYTRILCEIAVDAGCTYNESFWLQAWTEGIGACIWHALQNHNNIHTESIVTESNGLFVAQLLREQTAHTLMLRAAASEVLALFSRHGIDVVMLRGQAVAEALYEPPTLRPQTDIDLLIRQNDAECVSVFLINAGFRKVEGHALLFVRGQVMLDMHVEPLGIERMQAWALLTPLRAEDFFAAGVPGNISGQAALLVKPEVTLPYLCFHAMKHSFERLIWLWDIALLARQIGRDAAWDDVLTGIERFELARPCFYALSYAQKHLAADVPQAVLDTLNPNMGRWEQQLFERFMQHEKIPFLAERVFARMQPDIRHRMAFWKETVWPRAEVRKQVDGDSSSEGFLRKRMQQIGRAVVLLAGEVLSVLGRCFRRR